MILFSANAEQKDFFKDKKNLIQVDKNYLVYFIKDICTKTWEIRGRIYKADSQIQVIFHDKTGRNGAIFLDTINEINNVFGYDKLIPQISASKTPNNSSIIIFYGPTSEGRIKLRNFGAKTAPVNPWSYWSLWDDTENRAISKTMAAISYESISELRLSYAITRICLGALGFPGSCENYPGIPQSDGGGIFSRLRYPKNAKYKAEDQKYLISTFDRAVIRFVDRFIKTNSTLADVNKEIDANWIEFVEGFVNE